MDYRPDHNKSTWGEGEWQHEPDQVDFFDPDTGYQCVIVRGPMGSLNGYVGVPFGHPAYGLTYFDDKLAHIRVHGGLTYSGGPDEGTTEEVPLYWHGFDCSHAWDSIPRIRSLTPEGRFKETYRNFAYVRAEVLSLAKQLKDMETCDTSSSPSPLSEG